MRHDVVGREFPVQDELAGRRVVCGGDLAGKALRPGGGGVERGGEVLDGRVRVAVAQTGQQLRYPGVVLPDVGQGARGPLVVLLPVGRELGLPCGSPRPARRTSPARSGRGPLPGRGRGGHRPASCPAAPDSAPGRASVPGWRGRRARTPRCARGATGHRGRTRGPTALGEEAGQGGDPAVQLLGAAAGVGLALLPVGRLALAVHPCHGAFRVPGLPFLVALLLCSRAALGFLLALLLPLRLGPDGH